MVERNESALRKRIHELEEELARLRGEEISKIRAGEYQAGFDAGTATIPTYREENACLTGELGRVRGIREAGEES